MTWAEYTAKQKRLGNTRNKALHLARMLAERGIPGTVWYSWTSPPGIGWMHSLPRKKDVPQRIGHNYAQAVEMIESGTMDFLAGWEEAKPLASAEETP